MKRINPLTDIGQQLQAVENPVRYLGGEFGQIVKKDADFTFAVAFPDVYEIGMSNQAVRILYSGLNRAANVRCERVFAPETDFETLLKTKNIPLYTLESGIPLCDTDVIGFSIGYELGMSGVFSILESGFVPLLNSERQENHPIVMAGGCGVTNPAPFAAFFDAVFIGEAENELFTLIEQAAALKKKGAARADILKQLTAHKSVWVPGKKAVRAVYGNFGLEPSLPAWFPVPAIKVVQGHGVVEIMRGCPNGCRFCHAGIYYRPQRVKQIDRIIEETDRLVHEGGYHEISLSSLSSGDYGEISLLLDSLNARYEGKNISFQLPSLKVNSFTLPILEKLSEVRKGGLTFAIETPVEAWQVSLNKEVYAERIVDIIQEAKKRGWNKAKFYFMVGLPVETGGQFEETAIVDFMLKIQAATRIQCNVNVGTFIPKPHTPYERVRQLDPEEAEEKLYYIRRNLPKGKFKVSTHGGFTSCLEGIISRGDGRVGGLLLQAYRAGCRLDAWENRLQKDIWQRVFEENNFDIKNALRSRSPDEVLPWHEVSLGVSPAFFKKEFDCSQKQQLTPRCEENCQNPCGVCNNSQHVTNKVQNVLNITHDENDSRHKTFPTHNIPILYRVIFSFSKIGGTEFIPHLGLIETFLRAFLRSGYNLVYTAGFNPIPRFELAASLSIGIRSLDETASCLLYEPTGTDSFISAMNKNLPEGLRINKAFIFPVSNKRKRESLAASLWGAENLYAFNPAAENSAAGTTVLNFTQMAEREALLTDGYTLEGNELRTRMAFKNDRAFRNKIAAYFNTELYNAVSITKLKTLAQAKKEISTVTEGAVISYFDLYADIAAINAQLV